MEDWIATQDSPERFTIVSFKKAANGIEEEAPRAAELDATLVAEERRLPSCTPIVLPYRVKVVATTASSCTHGTSIESRTLRFVAQCVGLIIIAMTDVDDDCGALASMEVNACS